MRIGIIGGGPAGMLAAIEASKKYSDVTIIDANLEPGRKLASTGAGRGNLTNTNIHPESYDGYDKFAFSGLIEKYDYNFLQNYFNDIGIFTYQTDDGWVYPISNSAKNTAEYLAEIIQSRNIKLIGQSYVVSMSQLSGKFNLKLDNNSTIDFDKVVIASGGRAYPQLKSSDSILQTLKQFGHKIIPAYPALAPLETSKNQSGLLNGVRLNAEITLRENKTNIKSEFGNIIFTDWGVNGPGVMNLSHLYHKITGTCYLKINFCYPEIRNKIISNLHNVNLNSVKAGVILNTFFPMKIINQIFINSKINPSVILADLSEESKLKLIESMQISEKVVGTRGFSYSQLSTGAVNSKDINPFTLESRIIPEMFFAGEVLDVLGPCGGFNLHWAFISGITAGRSL